MTPSMVDTQVLSYALAVEPAKDEKMRLLQRDCAALIGSMAEVKNLRTQSPPDLDGPLFAQQR